jgi:hypothetical protein
VSSGKKDSDKGLGAPCLDREQVWSCSPWLGEMVVGVGAMFRWEEHHVIIKAEGHELKTPKPDHHVELQRVFRISHPDP